MKRIKYIISLILFSNLFAQNNSIEGIILDSSNKKPLVAANVLIKDNKGFSNGASTDENGKYTIINIPNGEFIIKVDYIGFETQEKTLVVGSNQKYNLDFNLAPSAIEFDTYVVTASRRKERIEDAPAAISIITKQSIRRESNTNLGDYLKNVKGVDFTQSGVDSYNLSARGFNSSFSSRLLTLTDGRMANVPSLRLTAYNVIPVSFEDVEQIEVVLGPSSALYGPNAHSGVLNIVTRAPRDSKGTVFNVQTGYLSQKNSKPLQKITFRHANTWKNFGYKVSGVALNAYDWRHYNGDEFEGHDPAFLGRPHLIKDGIDNQGKNDHELLNPKFNEDMLIELTKGEILNNGIDDNGNGFIDESMDMIGYAYADGMVNLNFKFGETNSPLINESMVDIAQNDPFNRLCIDEGVINAYADNCSGEIIWGVTSSNIGKQYKDGVDNNGNGAIDEKIDTGIDGRDELFYDGIDNDGDGKIDELDEVNANSWLNRFDNYSKGSNGQGTGFGAYKYDDEGNLLFDTNQNGVFGDDEDFVLNKGELSQWIKDSNGDGLDDFPDFNVENYRYDIRLDYDPNPDLNVNFSHGYAYAKNINITGIARFLADGWVYNYYQSRLSYKNFFWQSYLNTSNSGEYNPNYPLALSPTRNLATGSTIFDRSKKFSSQFQHSINLMNENLRFVWGADYFLTMPNTKGTILADNNLSNKRDDNGNGEAGSPISWTDYNDNFNYDKGEMFNIWKTHNGLQDGEFEPIDNVKGAIADGIDNDGDGLIDEGIDEKSEDNRYIVNEFGAYYQINWKLNSKFELIHATRFDAHDRLTNFIDFNNYDYNYNPLKWKFNFKEKKGLQVSPKLGLVYRPKENQNFRLTWAKAFNTPSNQALFLDIFVTRVATYKVYARGANNGYIYPRGENGNIFWKDPYDPFTLNEFDSTSHVFFFPTTDPNNRGFFKDKVLDQGGIYPEEVHTLELGYKGRITPNIYATLDVFRSNYSSFVSAITFITPIVLSKEVITTDYNQNGLINEDPDNIVDEEDLDYSYDIWTSYIDGVSAIDTSSGINPPVVVGYVNYGNVNMGGIDMSLSIFLSKNWNLDINYSFLSMSSFINPITNVKDPINAPKNKGNLKLQYTNHNGKFNTSLSLRYVEKFPWQSGVYFGTIGPYTIFDLHARYQIVDKVAGLLTVSNIFNDSHIEIQGGPAIGRVLMFRLQAEL